MRAFLIILTTTILLSCAGRQDCLTLGSKLHFSKDELERDVRRSQSRQSKVGSSIRFVVVNNPYCFTEEDRIAIYMDDACVFFGSFSRNGLLAVPEEVLSRGQTHVRFLLLRGDSVYGYQNKSFTPLDSEDKYLYVCFFESEDHTRRVYFFPARKSCIQI
jgi:hypothetical protein